MKNFTPPPKKKSTRVPPATGLTNSTYPYNGIFNSISLPLLIIDPQTAQIIAANPAVCKFYGYSHQDFLQKKISDLAAIPFAEAWQQIPTLAAGEIAHIVLSHRCANGEIRDVQMDFNRDNLFGDKPVAIVTVHDVTYEKQTHHDLTERVKELTAFYSFNNIVNEEGYDQPERIYRRIIDLLPRSWQYPEITCGLLTINDRQFSTANFKDTPWQQSASIMLGENIIGSIEIGYLVECPPSDEGPFLKEERLLLDSLAHQLGNLVARIQSDRERRISEERYKQQYKNLPVPTFTYLKKGLDFVVIDVNDATLTTTGGAAAHLLGKTASEMYADDPRVPADIAECFSSRTVIRHEMETVLRSTGARRYVIGTYVFVPPDMVVVHAEDITEQKQAEHTLQVSEQKYHGFVTQANEAFALVDENGVLIDWNPMAEKLIGIPASEVLGKYVWDMQHSITAQPATPESLTRIRQSIEDLLKTGTSPLLGTYETKLKRADGEEIIVSQKLFTIKTAQGFHMASIARDVTQERYNQQQLKTSEERYRLLFENMREGFALFQVLTDKNGRPVDARIQAVNAAYGLHTGLDPAEVVGKTILEVFPTLDREKLESYFEVAQTGKSISSESFSDFLQRHFYSKFFCPQPGQFALVIEDITERKKSEFLLQAINIELEKQVQERTAELSHTLARLNLATNTAGMGIWDWDIQKDVVLWDDQMYSLYGVKAEDFSGAYQAWVQGIHPDDRQASTLASEQARKGEKEYDTEFRVLWPDGAVHWLKANGKVFWDQSGKPVRMLGVNYDITARKRLENEARENSERYQTLFQKLAMPASLFKLPGWIIQDVNEASEELLGYTRQEMVGKSGIDLWYVESEHLDVISTVEQTGELSGHEISLKTKSGQEVIVIVRAVPVSIAGQPFLLSTLFDITQRKQAEQKLSESNQALKKALTAKDEFMAAMSHELRTPLTGIMGMTELLQMTAADALNLKQVGYLAAIEKNSDRLLRLINNLLEFTHLQSSIEALDLHPCSLKEVCQAALQQMLPISNAKQQQTHFSSVPSEVILETDERRLRKVLSWLLENASKFTPAGGEFGIEISGLPDDKQVHITIWDTGIGIAEQDFPRLFKPFTQLDASLSRQYEGVGLGLALSKGVIELLNGAISVQSTPGKGSRFTIILPLSSRSIP